MKKTTIIFLVFLTYLHMVLLKFQVEALIGWGIQLSIQLLPTQHTFGGPHSTKNEKYMKKCDVDVSITFLHGAGSIKSMLSGCLLDMELNSLSNECSHSKFE